LKKSKLFLISKAFIRGNQKFFRLFFMLLPMKFLFLMFFISFSLQAQYTWEQLREQAVAAYKAGNLPDAAATYEQVLQKAFKEFGKQDERYSQTAYASAFVYCKLQNYKRAEELYLEGKNTAEKKTGKTSREYALMCNKLAVDIYLVQKKFNEAEHLLTEVMLIEEKRLGKDHPEYAIALFNLGVCYYEQKKFSDAETLLLKAKNILEKTLGKKHQDYVLVCSYLIKLYESQNRKVLAAMLQKELQEVFKN